MRVTGVEVQLHSFLTSVLEERVWSASRPDRFTPGNRPRPNWIEDGVDLRATLVVQPVT